MSEEVWCRLCLNICNDYRCLCDETGQCNAELYDVTVQYFDPTILSAWDENTPQTVMCSKCWRQISEFHSFQNDILLAQEQLRTTGKPFEVHVKEEHPLLDAKDDLTDAVDTIIVNDIDVKNANEFLPLTDLELMATSHSTSGMANSHIELLVPMTEEVYQYEIREIDVFGVNDNSPNEEAEQDTEQFPKEDDDRIGLFAGESIDLCLSDTDSNAVELSSDDESSSAPHAAKRKRSDYEISKAQLTPRVLGRPNARKENDAYIARWLPKLNCPICNVECLQFSFLPKHFEEYHLGVAAYAQCCEKKFYRRYQLAEHIRLHLEPDRFKCVSCGMSYLTNAALREHMIKIHPKSEAALSYAPRSDKKIDAIIAKWKPNLECAVCNKTYPNVTELSEHFKLQHPNEAFHILCCNRKFIMLRDIREHAVSHAVKKANR